ncbi:hypothetical protein [Boudabousia marimammalium]|uniref:Uncharacterized protein n=1 Tax=Boudabousia marimammalium TaxID=156892 RepID=A0A1Q5PS65_9ACTO|nr:hypothetical protein [Boudabousia marimammalium]OKL50417.1 hypothetical protein BM477_00090 [Boudabousia marimammalium]
MHALFSLIPTLMLLVPLIAAVAIIWVWQSQHRSALSQITSHYPQLQQMHRTTWLVQGIALFLALLTVPLTGLLGPLGLGNALSPTIFGIILIAGILLHQRLHYRAATQPGKAALERRTARQYVTKRPAIVSALAVLLLLTLVVFSHYLAAPDEAGRMRNYQVACQGSLQSSSPFPGSYYTLPVLAGLAITVVVAGFTLWFNARRPRNGADPQLVAADDTLRFNSAESVLSAVGLTTAASSLGLSTFGVVTTATTCELESWGAALIPGIYVVFTLAAIILCLLSLVFYLSPLSGYTKLSLGQREAEGRK